MSLPILKKDYSFTTCLEDQSNFNFISRDILEAEASWHYSNHYLAECKGEEVISDLLLLATHKKQRALLFAQLNDEKVHSQFFKKIIDKIGLQTSANKYSEGYSELVKSQKSLAEKVHVFQIITEAASAAYCGWRLQAMEDSRFSGVDRMVQLDEVQHLSMGRSMLSICDKDEISLHLTKDRRFELLRKMNDICKLSSQKNVIESVAIDKKDLFKNFKTSLLDKLVTKSIFQEAKNVENLLNPYNQITGDLI